MTAVRFLRSALGAALLGVCVLALPPRSAFAAPSSQDRSTAKSAWTKGKKLASQKKYQDAIEALRQADSLDPKAQYKLDLARALAETGKLVEASELCTAISGSTEQAKSEKAAAEKLASSLAARIPHVRVEVSAGRDAVAKIDGEEVTIGEDVVRNPGTHTVQAEAPGYRPASQDVSLDEGAKKTVNLTLAAEVTMTKDGDDEKKSSGGTMAPAGVAFGVGGAGVVLGTVFGVLAIKATKDVQSRCKGNLCPSSEKGNIITAKTDGNVATAGFVVGGVGIATGIVLALTVGRSHGSKADKTKTDDKPEEEKTGYVVPMIGPGSVGVMGAF